MIKMILIASLMSLNSYAKSVEVEIKKDKIVIHKTSIKKLKTKVYVDLAFHEIDDFKCSLVDLGEDVNSVILTCTQIFKTGSTKNELAFNSAFLCNDEFQAHEVSLFKEYRNVMGATLNSSNSYMMRLKCKGK